MTKVAKIVGVTLVVVLLLTLIVFLSVNTKSESFVDRTTSSDPDRLTKQHKLNSHKYKY